MSTTNLFCQVGFGYKKAPKDIYFHTRDGEAIGFELSIPDVDSYLDPFSIEDLLAGKIDFELLPEDLRETMQSLASRTFQIIREENPAEVVKLNPEDVEALFYTEELPKSLS